MKQDEEIGQAMQEKLEALRKDLTQGRLSHLAAHAEQIESLLPRLSAMADRKLAERLRDKALGNEACLAAARRGVIAARQRLAELLAASKGFSTYDVQGRRAQIEALSQQLSQRI